MLLDLAFSLALRLADAISQLIPSVPEAWLAFFDDYRTTMVEIGAAVPILAYLPIGPMLGWLTSFIGIAVTVLIVGITRRVLKTVQGWITGGGK